MQDKRAVGKLVELGHVVELRACAGGDPFAVELRVYRVGSDLTRMQLGPDRREAIVVLAAAERARAMSGGKRGRLVEEEQLSEAARLQERATLPAAELEPTGDPALAGIAPPNAPRLVVQATSISVYEAAGGIRDEVAERSDPVLQRHVQRQT